MAELSELLARINELEMRLAKVDDRAAICDVLYSYARAADRADLELLKSCYWPDGTDVHWFYNGNAHEFADYVVPLLAEIDNSQHSITNPIIDFDGDRAFVECQWYVVHHVQLNDDAGTYVDQQMEGRYIDIFERRVGTWRIWHRQIVIEAQREHCVVPSFVLPADHPGIGQRAPKDVVYRGFDLLQEPIVPVHGTDLWGDARQRHSDG